MWLPMMCFPTVQQSVCHSVQVSFPAGWRHLLWEGFPAGSVLPYRLRTPQEPVPAQAPKQAKDSSSLLLVHRRNHFRVLFEHFRGAGVVAHIAVQGGDLRHFLIRQGKIKEVKVGLDMVGVLGSGDDDVAALDVPAEDDLGIGLAVFLAQCSQLRLEGVG